MDSGQLFQWLIVSVSTVGVLITVIGGLVYKGLREKDEEASKKIEEANKRAHDFDLALQELRLRLEGVGERRNLVGEFRNELAMALPSRLPSVAPPVAHDHEVDASQAGYRVSTDSEKVLEKFNSEKKNKPGIDKYDGRLKFGWEAENMDGGLKHD